jgi:hypothetical protein
MTKFFNLTAGISWFSNQAQWWRQVKNGVRLK